MHLLIWTRIELASIFVDKKVHCLTLLIFSSLSQADPAHHPYGGIRSPRSLGARLAICAHMAARGGTVTCALHCTEGDPRASPPATDHAARRRSCAPCTCMAQAGMRESAGAGWKALKGALHTDYPF